MGALKPTAGPELDVATARRRLLPVFIAAGRTWAVGDVLALATSVLAEPTQVATSAALARPTSTSVPSAIDEAAVDAAVRDFRYEYGLISAEECTAWLATRGLNFAELRVSIRRRLARSSAPTQAAAEIDLLLGSAFTQAAQALAVRIAAAIEAQALPESAPTACWPELEACYQRFVSATTTAAARERVLALDRLHWLQVECEVLEFDQLDAAREARHCVDDGQSLSEIAALGRFAHRSGRWLVPALPKGWAQALFRIRPGLVSQPIAEGERVLLLGFTRLIEPSLSDPEIYAGINNAVLQPALQALLARHIQWLLPGIEMRQSA